MSVRYATLVDCDGAPKRRCATCRSWKPATLEHFYANPDGADGIGYHCRDCHRAWARQRKERLRIAALAVAADAVLFLATATRRWGLRAPSAAVNEPREEIAA